MPGKHRPRGRVEDGLENELRTRHDIGSAERSALRAQAHIIDLAEVACDVELLTKANDVYLRLRQAAGLTVGGAPKPVDAFDELLRQLAQPGAGASDTANT
jgi:hypothetical protein